MIDPDAMKEFSARHAGPKRTPPFGPKPPSIVPPRPREPSADDRIAAALERIADAFERAHPTEEDTGPYGVEDIEANALTAGDQDSGFFSYLDMFQAFPTPERIRAAVTANPDLEPGAVLLSALLSAEQHRRGNPPENWRQVMALEVLRAFGGSAGTENDPPVLALALKAGIQAGGLSFSPKDFPDGRPDWNALQAMPYSKIIGGTP